MAGLLETPAQAITDGVFAPVKPNRHRAVFDSRFYALKFKLLVRMLTSSRQICALVRQRHEHQLGGSERKTRVDPTLRWQRRRERFSSDKQLTSSPTTAISSAGKSFAVQRHGQTIDTTSQVFPTIQRRKYGFCAQVNRFY